MWIESLLRNIGHEAAVVQMLPPMGQVAVLPAATAQSSFLASESCAWTVPGRSHTRTNTNWKQHGSTNHPIEIVQHLLVNVQSPRNRNELRLCANQYIVKYDMQYNYTRRLTRHTLTQTHTEEHPETHTHTLSNIGWFVSWCMRKRCAHPTTPMPTYQLRPGTTHTTSYSYILSDNKMIIKSLIINIIHHWLKKVLIIKLSANPSIYLSV